MSLSFSPWAVLGSAEAGDRAECFTRAGFLHFRALWCGGSAHPTGVHSQPSAPLLLTAAIAQQLTRFPESLAVNGAILQGGEGFRAECLIRA